MVQQVPDGWLWATTTSFMLLEQRSALEQHVCRVDKSCRMACMPDSVMLGGLQVPSQLQCHLSASCTTPPQIAQSRPCTEAQTLSESCTYMASAACKQHAGTPVPVLALVEA